MGEPFTASTRFQGISEESSSVIKIKAATDFLIKQLKSLTDGDVAVLSFSDSPQLLFKGDSRDTARLQERIEHVRPSGRTNIGDALLCGLKLPSLDSYRVISFLLISDGLSTTGDPISAAKQCADSRLPITISTILIDPTPEGEEMARAISIGGDVKAVTSSSQLRDAIEKEGQTHEAAVRGIEKKADSPMLSISAAVLALIITLSSLYTTVVERPSVALLSTLAAITTLAAGAFMFVAFRKEDSANGIYKGPHDRDFYVPRSFKYSRLVRSLAIVLSIICIVVSAGLVQVAAARAARDQSKVASVPGNAPTHAPKLPMNLATNARVAANSELSVDYLAKYVCDGNIPKPQSKEDRHQAWCVDTNSVSGPVELRFVWDSPVLIDTIVYYGRTARSLSECWKSASVFVNGITNPIIRIRLEPRHGAQPMMLPVPTLATNVTLEFRTSYGGRFPGASEIQIFSETPADEAPERTVR